MAAKSMKKGQWVSLILAIVAFLGLYFMPRPAGLSGVAQKSLAMFVFSLIMWIGKPIPIYLRHPSFPFCSCRCWEL